jgi:hypothetical protein
MKSSHLFHVTDCMFSESLRSKFSLMKLIDCIVDHSDPLEFEEVLSRPLSFGQVNLCFIEYFYRRREHASRGIPNIRNCSVISEIACDLTPKKFSNLTKKKNKQGWSVKHNGPDCRLYFDALRRSITSSFKTNPHVDELEREARAGV